MLVKDLWLLVKNLCHGQQSEVLQVLISIFNKQSQLGHTQLHGGCVIGHPRYHSGDALIEKGHGRGAMDKVGKRFDQLLAESRL